ncbi:MAG: hypothetical protein WC518_02320 [Patescibacteria group bacterium]
MAKAIPASRQMQTLTKSQVKVYPGVLMGLLTVSSAAVIAVFIFKIITGGMPGVVTLPGSTWTCSESNSNEMHNNVTISTIPYLSSFNASTGGLGNVKFFDIYNKSTADCVRGGSRTAYEDKCLIDVCSGTSCKSTPVASCSKTDRNCRLQEGFVKNSAGVTPTVSNWLYKCPDGCSDGACINLSAGSVNLEKSEIVLAGIIQVGTSNVGIGSFNFIVRNDNDIVINKLPLYVQGSPISGINSNNFSNFKLFSDDGRMLSRLILDTTTTPLTPALKLDTPLTAKFGVNKYIIKADVLNSVSGQTMRLVFSMPILATDAISGRAISFFPASGIVNLNTQTFLSGSLSIEKDSADVPQTIKPGTINANMGSFIFVKKGLDTIKVQKIPVKFNGTNGTSTINLKKIVDKNGNPVAGYFENAIITPGQTTYFLVTTPVQMETGTNKYSIICDIPSNASESDVYFSIDGNSIQAIDQNIGYFIDVTPKTPISLSYRYIR